MEQVLDQPKQTESLKCHFDQCDLTWNSQHRSWICWRCGAVYSSRLGGEKYDKMESDFITFIRI